MRINDYQLNRLRVLKAIRRTAHVTRTDLVASTGLAAGSITQLTGDLVRRGVVQEEKAAKKVPGRPRIRLSINPTAAYAVGVLLFPDARVAVEIVNLLGEVVHAEEQKLLPVRTLKDWIRQLTRCVERGLKSSPVARRDVAHVAIPVPGIVDNVRGIVHWMATFPDRDVPVKKLMQDKLGIPVSIDNSTSLLARAEHWFGEHCLDNFSLIHVEQTVMSAHYVDGSLWTGSHGINPELAHTKPGFGDEHPCYCGMRGCLATYCAMYGIATRVALLRGQKMPGERDIIRPYRRVAKEAKEGEPIALQTFTEAGRLLGVTVANLLNERDPGAVIVVTPDADLLALTKQAFFAAIGNAAIPAIRERTDIRFRLLDPEQSRKGAAALALEQIYMSDNSPPPPRRR